MDIDFEVVGGGGARPGPTYPQAQSCSLTRTRSRHSISKQWEMHRKTEDNTYLSSRFVTLFVLYYIESATWPMMLKDDVQVSSNDIRGCG